MQDKVKIRTEISEKASDYLHTLSNKYGFTQRILIAAIIEAHACGCVTEGFIILKAHKMQEEAPKRGRPAKID